MGVDISSLLVREPVSLEDLRGRKIAVDAMNVLYQFLSIIRQPDGTPLKDSHGNITSHLSGLFYRTIKMLEYGIKPVYVFDGAPPKFKTVTAERHAKRLEAAEKYKEAVAAGDAEAARKWATLSTRVDAKIIADAKELLRAMGVPFVEAPSEGEAQAAVMATRGEVWAVSSQDYDALLFGAPVLLRNIAVGSKRRLPGKKVYVDVEPEKIELKKVLEQNGITREQLIMIGIIIGTDFNPGGLKKGFGPKRALELARKHNDLKFLKDYEWTWDVSAQEIMDFFLTPPSVQTELKWAQPNVDELKRILVQEHDFSGERVDSAITKLQESKGTQQRLDFYKR